MPLTVKTAFQPDAPINGWGFRRFGWKKAAWLVDAIVAARQAA